jgi:N-acylneuraminate cytidylyltransferase
MANICIIPARGGSKRIPLKNIKNFLGKPILSYSIDAATNSGVFDEIMVSTDDECIAKTAIQYGAKVPFLRSSKNSSDHATTFEVLEEVLNQYSFNGYHFETCCCIYACAPLLQQKNITEGFEKIKENKFDTVFTAIQYATPIQRAFKITGNIATLFYPQYANSRSQDMEKAYYDAGQFYWCNTQSILSKKKIFTDNTGLIILDEMQAQDIDNISDWEIAELKYKLLNK